jgi:hypothetical protein
MLARHITSRVEISEYGARIFGCFVSSRGCHQRSEDRAKIAFENFDGIEWSVRAVSIEQVG